MEQTRYSLEKVFKWMGINKVNRKSRNQTKLEYIFVSDLTNNVGAKRVIKNVCNVKM